MYLYEEVFITNVLATGFVCTQDHRTALHYACEGDHRDTVRVLLEREADPYTCDKVSKM